MKATIISTLILFSLSCHAQGTGTQTTQVEKQYQMSDTTATVFVVLDANGSLKWADGFEVHNGFATMIDNKNFDSKKAISNSNPQKIFVWAKPENNQANPVLKEYLDKNKKSFAKGTRLLPFEILINQ